MAYSSQCPCDDWLDADAEAMWRKSGDEYYGDGGVAVALNDAHGLHKIRLGESLVRDAYGVSTRSRAQRCGSE